MDLVASQIILIHKIVPQITFICIKNMQKTCIFTCIFMLRATMCQWHVTAWYVNMMALTTPQDVPHVINNIFRYNYPWHIPPPTPPKLPQRV